MDWITNRLPTEADADNLGYVEINMGDGRPSYTPWENFSFFWAKGWRPAEVNPKKSSATNGPGNEPSTTKTQTPPLGEYKMKTTDKILIALALAYYCFWSPTGFFGQMGLMNSAVRWWFGC